MKIPASEIRAFPGWKIIIIRALIVCLLLAAAGAPPASAQGHCWICTISGRVTRAADGAPIAGAVVGAEIISPYYFGYFEAATDVWGRYSMVVPYLTDGYKVTVRAIGYYPEDYGTLTFIDPPPSINFTLKAEGIVTGHVYQQDGVTPIAGASIEIVPGGDWPVVIDNPEGTSNANGSYSTQARTFRQALPAGSYLVRAIAPGYDLEYYSDSPAPGTAAPVRLTADGVVPDIDFTLVPAGRILGHVYAADGVTPLPDISIDAYTPGVAEPVATAITSADGAYILDGTHTYGLWSGDYYLKAHGNGYQTEYYKDADTFVKAALVSVATATDTNGIDFSLIPQGGISGIVVGSDGITPVAGALIRIYSGEDQNINLMGVTSQADGRFSTSSALDSGHYYVYITAGGYIEEWYKQAIFDFDATPVNVVSPNITEITIEMRAAGSISGHVHRKDGITPMDTSRVCAKDIEDVARDFLVFCGLVGEDGAYTIEPLPGGRYILWAEKISRYGYPALQVYYNQKPDQAAADAITLTTGDHLTGFDFILGWEYYLLLPISAER